jgi:hypothetical protein
MRLHQLALVAVLALSVPAVLSAQTTQTTTTQQTTTTTSSYSDEHPSRWIASGFVGSNFSSNSDSQIGGINSPVTVVTSTGTTTISSNQASVEYGGQIGYLFSSMVGAEFLADFTPNFHLQNALLIGDTKPDVNTYMVNAIGAVPIGSDSRFQPFVSGGFGAMQMRGLDISQDVTGLGVITTPGGALVTSLIFPNQTHTAADIGGGVMAYAGGWGVRGDVRYFNAFGTSDAVTTTSGTTATTTIRLLPGLNFWRANIGVAFRW